jgi:hypothetical protein
VWREVAGEGPSRPPCVKIQNARGCSNARKAVQGFERSTRRALGSAVRSAVSTPFRAASSVVSRLRPK